MKNTAMANKETYQGFEQGPIRPPSEAASLLIRVTRNCPWNRCTFCPVYKRTRFSLRPVDHVLQDIEAVHQAVDLIQRNVAPDGVVRRAHLRDAAKDESQLDPAAFQAALHWTANGAASVFLQDANSLIIKPDDLVHILKRLKNRFPWIDRITSYARSHTIARIKDADLERFFKAGLDRIHIGLESGADAVLQHVVKGTTKAMQIKAGLKVKKAGMTLSEYVMPGLGGRELSETHAVQTADALNQIDPHFIRLRTLALPGRIPLTEEYRAGQFSKCTDKEMAREILLFLQALDGITSVIKSDHILNLFEEVEGRWPQDKARMTAVLETFLDMPPREQMLYQVGRRMGVFRALADMQSASRLNRVETVCGQMGITPDNVDGMVDELMKRFI